MASLRFGSRSFFVSFFQRNCLFSHFLSKFVWSHFDAIRFLCEDAMHACSHPGNFCPVPPCDMNHFDHPLCKHYVCQGGGKDKYCTFIGNCDGDVDCVKTAKYMSLDEDYYLDEADVQSEADYNENFSGRGINSTSSRSWLAYGILGGVLTAFIILAVLRKRVRLNFVWVIVEE